MSLNNYPLGFVIGGPVKAGMVTEGSRISRLMAKPVIWLYAKPAKATPPRLVGDRDLNSGNQTKG